MPSVYSPCFETIEQCGEDDSMVDLKFGCKAYLSRNGGRGNEDTAPTYVCPACGRGFFDQVGLTSHLRTHRKLIRISIAIFEKRSMNSSSKFACDCVDRFEHNRV